jgi:hypothetical protein
MRILHLTSIGRSSENKGMTGYEPKRLYVGSTRNYPGGYIAVTIFKCIIALIITRGISSLHLPEPTSKTIQERCDCVFTHFVSSKHSSIPAESERYPILNKCLGSSLTSRNFLVRHRYVYDQKSERLCLFLRRFNDYWYENLTSHFSYPANLLNFQELCKGLMKQLLWLSQESTIEDCLRTSFFSLGRTILVLDLRSVTTVSTPNLLKSEVLHPCSQFNSLVKNHCFEFTSFLQTSICQAVVAKCYDFFF